MHTGHFLERILQIHTTSTHFLRRKLRVSLGRFNILRWKLRKLAFKESNNFHLGHRSSSSPPGGPFSHMCPFSHFGTHFRTICIFSSHVFFVLFEHVFRCFIQPFLFHFFTNSKHRLVFTDMKCPWNVPITSLECAYNRTTELT